MLLRQHDIDLLELLVTGTNTVRLDESRKKVYTGHHRSSCNFNDHFLFQNLNFKTLKFISVKGFIRPIVYLFTLRFMAVHVINFLRQRQHVLKFVLYIVPHGVGPVRHQNVR